jgi:hypothetical protein
MGAFVFHFFFNLYFVVPSSVLHSCHLLVWSLGHRRERPAFPILILTDLILRADRLFVLTSYLFPAGERVRGSLLSLFLFCLLSISQFFPSVRGPYLQFLEGNSSYS